MCRTYFFFFFFFFFFQNVFIQAHCWLLIWLTDWLTYSVDSHKYLLTYLPFVLGLIDSRQDRTNRLCAAGVAGSCQVLITASCRSFFSQMKTYGYNFFAPGLTDWLTYLPFPIQTSKRRCDTGCAGRIHDDSSVWPMKAVYIKEPFWNRLRGAWLSIDQLAVHPLSRWHNKQAVYRGNRYSPKQGQSTLSLQRVYCITYLLTYWLT